MLTGPSVFRKRLQSIIAVPCALFRQLRCLPSIIMNTSLVRLLACPILALLCAGSSYSQEIKIGFISIERMVREAPASILAGKRMETEFSSRTTELRKLSAELASKKEYMAEKGSALSDGQRRIKENELNELDLLLQRRQRTLQEDIQARQNELTTAILTKGNEAVKQVAEREKLDMVIQDAAWVSPGIDITNQVLQILADDN